MISIFLFAPMYSKFTEQYPDHLIEMVESGSIESQKKIINDELDMAIVITNSTTQNYFHVLPLLKTHLLFCVSKNHQLANHKKLNFQKLQNEKIILMKSTSHETGALLLKRFDEQNIKPNIVLRSNQVYLIKQYILEQEAGGFFMREFSYMEGDIIGIPLDPPVEINIGLIWKKGKHLNTYSSNFIDFASMFINNSINM